MDKHNSISPVRLRIAPSPTGYPHIGTIYQALFNYAYAHKYAGKFIVRIEDTDRTRFVEGAEEVIFSALDWSNLTEDESPRKDGGYSPYRQSERLEIYHTYVQKLLDADKAYYAYYPKVEAGGKKDYTAKKEEARLETFPSTPPPPSSIAEMIESGDWIIRMRVPQNTTISFIDGIRGEITFASDQVTEQVLVKSDGFPTYHLAVVVDDHLMKITHVVRGEEWISSTPKHVLLYDYFGWEKPLFFHTPDLRNPDRSKLSKRHGHTNVNWYREQGYVPEALLNFLALQGWSHPEEKEIFSLDEFISLFELHDLKPVGPVFDLTKLNWMNQQYIQNMDIEALVERIKHHLPEFALLDDHLLIELVALAQTRMEVLNDFKSLAQHFLTPPSQEERLKDEKDQDVAKALFEKLSALDIWNKEHIFAVCKEVMQETGVRMPVLYRLVTGAERGLPLPESMVLLGQEAVLKRLQELS